MQIICSFIKQFSRKTHVFSTTLLKSLKHKRSFGKIGLIKAEPADYGTMEDVSFKIKQIMGVKKFGYEKATQKREHLLKYTPKAEDLPPRFMSDSYMTAVIPLSCKDMQVKFVTPIGTVRIGRLIEQMDLFAVCVCFRHVSIPKLPTDLNTPVTFVTVLVDKMVFCGFLPEYNHDIKISGFTSWVGNTSLEITLWMEQKHKDRYRHITQAVFLMACRNATSTKGAPINSLQLRNDEEKSIFKLGEQRRQKRKQVNESSIFKVKPTEEEHQMIYNLFKNTADTSILRLNNRVLPTDSKWMSNSFVATTFLSFPEYRNNLNKVFGGFIMRQAFEISWLCAYQYCGDRPFCQRSCDVNFEKPLEVSSFIKMNAYVVYTEDNRMQIMTIAEVLDLKTRSAITTNTFNYTFSSVHKVQLVVPKSYQETMWYIYGRRKFNDAKNAS